MSRKPLSDMLSVRGIGSRGKRQTSTAFSSVSSFLVGHSKTLFLIHDNYSQFRKANIFREQPVRSDNQSISRPRRRWQSLSVPFVERKPRKH